MTEYEPKIVTIEEKVKIMLDGVRRIEKDNVAGYSDPVLQTMKRTLEYVSTPGLGGGTISTPSGRLTFNFLAKHTEDEGNTEEVADPLVEKINSLIAQVDIAIARDLLNKKTTDPKAFSLRFGALSTARQAYASVWEILIGIKGERSLILPDATSLHLYEEKPSEDMNNIVMAMREMLPREKDNG